MSFTFYFTLKYQHSYGADAAIPRAFMNEPIFCPLDHFIGVGEDSKQTSMLSAIFNIITLKN